MSEVLGDTTPTLEHEGRTRSEFNQEQLDELKQAEDYAKIALQEEHLPLFEKEDVEEDELKDLLADIKRCRALGAEAVGQTHGKEDDTDDKSDVAKALIESLKTVQRKAKRKYARRDPQKLAAYLIGTHLKADDTLLDTHAETIINALRGDDLPGWNAAAKAAKIAEIEAHRLAFANADQTQGTSQSQASGTRAERNALVKSIIDRRIDLQLAANSIWPPKNPLTAHKRTAFGLLPDREPGV